MMVVGTTEKKDSECNVRDKEMGRMGTQAHYKKKY